MKESSKKVRPLLLHFKSTIKGVAKEGGKRKILKIFFAPGFPDQDESRSSKHKKSKQGKLFYGNVEITDFKIN
jgi:hypothetical protein